MVRPPIDPNAPTLASGGAADGETPTTGPLIGRFVVGGTLGQGGMGVVLRAHDPELGRAVAIKLLRADQHEHGRVRLGREAQAMAKLNHPNVVTVYDVGEYDGATYIAMELVEGGTLRGWRRAAPRTWREIVAIYVAAGRGLAAAHAAGLVHRDFKPDNVLIGDDGRPRVSDFGIVAAPTGAIDSGSIRGAALDGNLTVQGAVLGTPAYMAPEQWRGQPVDARSDQFAFCVALWEALHGERPFAGTTTAELRDAICAGERRPPKVAVPRGLTAALERGLATESAARWPSLDALLAALAARSRSRRGRAIAAAAAGLVVAGGAVVALTWSRASAPSCRSLERQMDDVWNDASRAQITRVFPRGHASSLIEPLDSYTSTWVTTRIDACEADRRGERTATVRDAQRACFDGALARLDRVVNAIASDTLELSQASTAVANLPTLGRCSDLPVLSALVPRPTDPALAARLAEVERVLSDAATEYGFDRFAAARDLASGVRAEAESVGYPPTTAAVLNMIGASMAQLGDSEPAEEVLRASLRAADGGRDDHGRLEAYCLLIDLVGTDRGRIAEGRALLADARSVLARIHAPTAYKARLLALEGNLEADQGNIPRQIELLQEARPLFEEAFGVDGMQYAEVEYSLGGALIVSGDVASGEPMLERARATMVRYQGEETPTIAKIDNVRAMARMMRGDLDGAIELQVSSLALRERLEGADSPTLGVGLYMLGGLYKTAGRHDEAVRTMTRALPLLERAHGKDHRRVAMALNELAENLLDTDKPAEAAPYAARAVDIADRLDVGANTEARARFLLADALPEKDHRRARALAERARDEFRANGLENEAKVVDAWLAEQ